MMWLADHVYWSIIGAVCLFMLLLACLAGVMDCQRIENRDRAIKSLSDRMDAVERQVGIQP
jgi:hypothetical protein